MPSGTATLSRPAQRTSEVVENVALQGRVLTITVKLATVAASGEPIIVPENLAECVFPIVKYIHSLRQNGEGPDAIVALDTGARPIGLAVSLLHGKLFGSLPTIAGKLDFLRVSKRDPSSRTERNVAAFVDRVFRENPIQTRPTVLILDDCTASGVTFDITDALLRRISGERITPYYGVLVGGGADVVGTTRYANWEWHDRAALIGVSYSYLTGKPRLHRTTESLWYRERISEGVSKLVNKLRPDNNSQNLPALRA